MDAGHRSSSPSRRGFDSNICVWFDKVFFTSASLFNNRRQRNLPPLESAIPRVLCRENQEKLYFQRNIGITCCVTFSLMSVLEIKLDVI